MLMDLTSLRLYVKPGPTDMRKQSAGLAVLIQDELGMDPFDQAVYVFCNRRRNLIKAVYWEKNGFCLWQKRLEKDRFPWPSGRDEVQEISVRNWQLLLEGLDIWKAHQHLDYREVG